MSNKISLDQAQLEVDSWLDYKKVSDSKRELRRDQIKTIVDAMAEGELSLNEDKTFDQALKFPVGAGDSITKLTYKPRLKEATIHLHLSNVKSDDPDGRLLAHIAALTGNPKDLLKGLDTEDYGTAQAIAYFFL